MRVTKPPGSVTGTESTEVREPKTKNKISERVQRGVKGMEGNGGQVREEGTPIVVAQKRTKVKNNYAYEKVTVDV